LGFVLGSYAGAVLGIPLSGMLTEYINWQVAFYFYGKVICWNVFNIFKESIGVIGIIWSIYWWYYSYERPAIHPKISEAERIYIEESIGEASSIANKTWIKPPWGCFFRSKPVWAIIVANFCRSWSFYLLINSQAEYFREALDYNVGKVRSIEFLFIIISKKKFFFRIHF
jgi:ACS family sodium-dependent inorganic phosphate cotransporter-like MFS transporter 6/7/8